MDRHMRMLHVRRNAWAKGDAAPELSLTLHGSACAASELPTYQLAPYRAFSNPTRLALRPFRMLVHVPQVTECTLSPETALAGERPQACRLEWHHWAPFPPWTESTLLNQTTYGPCASSLAPRLWAAGCRASAPAARPDFFESSTGPWRPRSLCGEPGRLELCAGLLLVRVASVLKQGCLGT